MASVERQLELCGSLWVWVSPEFGDGDWDWEVEELLRRHPRKSGGKVGWLVETLCFDNSQNALGVWCEAPPWGYPGEGWRCPHGALYVLWRGEWVRVGEVPAPLR